MAELHVIGQIEGASGFTSPNLFCKWGFEHGQNWRLLEGDKEGQTQIDYPEHTDLTVWSHPIDVHYATKGIQGWPRLRFEVWHTDSFGRNEIYGYAFVHVPSSPGTFELDVVTWRPCGTLKEQITSMFIGGAPQLAHEDIITSERDRFRLNTETSGVIHLQLSIIMKDFNLYGVSTKA
eukprot:TRINITY_DN24103_c0_g1_i1.p1 TRINITY_DN24103_c0_g1~~TRINITY_DN24103_c0_g1_i1.p1  ORF type:complete len:178 (+),score=6.45 TRINITY_DN24103_c0_g1_i1:212-745(+)